MKFINFSSYETPVGTITIAANNDYLCGVWFKEDKFFKESYKDYIFENAKNAIITETEEWLKLYFSGENPDFTPPLFVQGSDFRKAVSDIMLKIPYGHITTYGAIAKEVAGIFSKEKMSAQAVGGAVSHNPISIIIPCHRVVASNMNITGYAAGIDKKIFLLKLEGVKVKMLPNNKEAIVST